MKKGKLVVLGAVVGLGVAAATFLTSKKGKELQARLLKKVDEMQEKLTDIEVSEVTQAVSSKLDEVKEAILDFDWETPREEIGEKYLELRDKLKVIKEHVDIVNIKFDKDSDDSEEEFTLEIDKTQEAVAE